MYTREMRATTSCNSLILTLGIAIAAGGCGESASVGIGAMGGSVSNLGATITIPAGALSQTQTVTIGSTSTVAPEWLQTDSPVFAFGPDNLALAKPATVCLPIVGSSTNTAVFVATSLPGSFARREGTIVNGQICIDVVRLSVVCVGSLRTGVGFSFNNAPGWFPTLPNAPAASLSADLGGIGGGLNELVTLDADSTLHLLTHMSQNLVSGLFANQPGKVAGAIPLRDATTGSADLAIASSIGTIVIGTSDIQGFPFGPSSKRTVAGSSSPISFIASRDIDGDGLEDIIAIDGAGGTLTRLPASGSFAPGAPIPFVMATGDQVTSLFVEDINDDKSADVVTLNRGSAGATNYLAASIGGAAYFTPLQSFAGANPISLTLVNFEGDHLTAFDLDKDGHRDLAVLSTSADGKSVSVTPLLNQPSAPGHFSEAKAVVFAPAASSTESPFATSGDFNVDGNLDFVVVWGAAAVIEFGNGDGTFFAAPIQISPSSKTTSIHLADANSDGVPDLFIVGTSGVEVFLGSLNSMVASRDMSALGPPPDLSMMCLPSGSKCTGSAPYCCDLTCINGVCCGLVGDSCTTNIDCCSGTTCMNGKCGAPTCFNAGEQCNNPPFTCCGAATGAICSTINGAPSICCQDLAKPCTQLSDCCQATFAGAQCLNGKCCAGQGFICSQLGGGVCCSGVCMPGGTCKP